MPKIVITEIDETTPGVVSESTDVVYIPGFVDIDQDILYDEKGNYVGLEVNTPTMFTSVAAFESLCGTKPVHFTADQKYTDLHTQSIPAGEEGEVVYNGFTEDAVPYDDIMFNAGDADPSYVMAKELLASGLSVVYERVNGKEEYEYQQITPTGSLRGYYFHSTDGAPVLMFKRAFPNYVDGDEIPIPEPNVDYYSPQKVGGTGPTKFVKVDSPTTQEGAEWETWKTLVPTLGIGITLTPNIGYNLITDDYNKFSEVDVVYERVTTGGTCTIKTMYSALANIFDISNKQGIVDKGNFSIKYLTSGGYPVFEYTADPNSTNTLVSKMLTMAEERGDCVALIDHTNNTKRSLNPNVGNGSVYESLNQFETTNGDFGAMFTPYITYNRTTADKNMLVTDDEKNGRSTTVDKDYITATSITAPASFAYLTSLADSIKTNANWLAIAGVTRGGVRNIGNMVNRVCNAYADDMQPRSGVSINAITNIKPYGNVIWGNRTMKNNGENLVATSFLNIRNLVSDVKKTCYRVARSTTFEQDTDVLWMNFKNSIATTLDRMVSGYGISGYKIVRDNTHEKAKEKATICARIILYPTYAVEDFYITVVLKDSEVTVE